MASKGCKFSMGASIATAAKRPSESMPATDRSSKIPKASEMTMVERTPRQANIAQSLPSWAPVVVCVYKVTDEAGDVWKVFEEAKGVQLWQVQVQHEARPSITFGIRESFNDFLR